MLRGGRQPEAGWNRSYSDRGRPDQSCMPRPRPAAAARCWAARRKEEKIRNSVSFWRVLMSGGVLVAVPVRGYQGYRQIPREHERISDAGEWQVEKEAQIARPQGLGSPLSCSEIDMVVTLRVCVLVVMKGANCY